MTFEEAQDRVKIGHFTRKGHKITGVVHVGANDGYEIQFYLLLGATKVIAFEPLLSAYERMWTHYNEDPRVEMLNCALGEREGFSDLHITEGDGQGSSILRELAGPYVISGKERVAVIRGDAFGLQHENVNTLVVDTQGMELQVLKGFGDHLKTFSFLNIECSRVPLYEGGVSAQEVIDYLSEQGFERDSPIYDHDDIMFLRRGL